MEWLQEDRVQRQDSSYEANAIFLSTTLFGFAFKFPKDNFIAILQQFSKVLYFKEWKYIGLGRIRTHEQGLNKLKVCFTFLFKIT